MDAEGSATRPELVIAVVGAAGVPLSELETLLKAQLDSFGYRTAEIRLSALLPGYTGWTENTGPSEFSRIRHLQDMGNSLRKSAGDGTALARAAIVAIRERRAMASGDPDRPADAYAYIVHQLKHPAEVELLRTVYGASFVLIAGHAPLETRAGHLAKRMAEEENRAGEDAHFRSDAHKVIDIDEKQDDEFGQNTRDTYPMADLFVNTAIGSTEQSIRRFLELLFAHPFRTPTPDEYAMYQASAAALRSSDDNRQVGAVIASLVRSAHGSQRVTNADIIAVGMNEVPRGGGGFFWDDDSPDCRDQKLVQLGDDRPSQIKLAVLTELIERLRRKGWLASGYATKPVRDLARELAAELKGTQFMNISEFSRPVHAEMAALIDAARRGVAVNGHTMYVTTFPCHNCAKHIIAAGLRRVVYLEPYPKSRATILHKEEIVLESIDGLEQEGKLVFVPFSGVAPRQYRQLFSMAERGAKKGMSLNQWEAKKRELPPRHVPANAAFGYLPAERKELGKLDGRVFRWDVEKLCPDPK